MQVTIRKPATAPGELGEVVDQFTVPFAPVELVVCGDELSFVDADGKMVNAIDLE